MSRMTIEVAGQVFQGKSTHDSPEGEHWVLHAPDAEIIGSVCLPDDKDDDWLQGRLRGIAIKHLRKGQREP